MTTDPEMIPVYQDDHMSATLIDSEGFVIMAGDDDDPGDELLSPI